MNVARNRFTLRGAIALRETARLAEQGRTPDPDTAYWAAKAHQPNPNRQASGRDAGLAGKAFEHLVESSATDLKGRIMTLVKVPHAAERIPDRTKPFLNGKPQFVLQERKGPMDFVGLVAGGGPMIAFDAKSSRDGASLRVNSEEIIKRKQIETLEQLGRTGALAGVLVKCGRAGDYRWLPWQHLRQPKPVPWDDPAWVILGPIGIDGYENPIQFRRLLEWWGSMNWQAADGPAARAALAQCNLVGPTIGAGLDMISRCIAAAAVLGTICRAAGLTPGAAAADDLKAELLAQIGGASGE